MKIAEVRRILQASFLAGVGLEDREIVSVCDADLVSDVLSLESSGTGSVLLLTSLIGPQLTTMIAITNIKALVFVQGRQPGADFLQQAKKNGLVCLSTSLSKYEAAGLLYQAGLPGTKHAGGKEKAATVQEYDGLILIAEYTISGGDFLAAGHVTKKIKQRLENLGVYHQTVTRVAIAAYEAELNIIIHANRGRMQLKMSSDIILLTVEDEGPGIPDIDLAMQEGYSTAPAAVREMGYGAGMGLPNIRRCADSLNIQSEVETGTRLAIGFVIKHGSRRR